MDGEDPAVAGDDLYVTTTIDPESGDPNDGEATAHANLCISCPTHLELDQLSINGAEAREARDRITAASVTVQGSGDLTLQAGAVTLASGFEVLSGGKLTIVSETCE